MARLIVSAQMTLDAVIDHVDEWFLGEGDHEAAGREQLFAAGALLLGRETYQGLSRVWPTMSDDSGFAERVNSMPKFIASRTLRGELQWNASLLAGDLAEAVAAVKRQIDGTLLSYGCGELAYDLVQLGLVDEVALFVHPLVFGAGTRPFDLRGRVDLRLLEVRPFNSGVTLLRYRPRS